MVARCAESNQTGSADSQTVVFASKILKSDNILLRRERPDVPWGEKKTERSPHPSPPPLGVALLAVVDDGLGDGQREVNVAPLGVRVVDPLVRLVQERAARRHHGPSEDSCVLFNNMHDVILGICKTP